MNRDPRTESYLDAVTASIEGDDELRLDVRAELAAHLDDATARFQAEGHSPEASAEQAIRALGPAPAYAGDLVAANRRRMRLRGRIRLLLRALVVPAAVAATLISVRGFLNVSLLCGPLWNFAPDEAPFGGRVGRLLRWVVPTPDRFSPEQRLILHGDRTRQDTVAAQRAIWEAWPTNIVYLNNYLTAILASGAASEADARLDPTLDRATTLDPRNARYRYIRAARQLAQSAALESVDAGTNAPGQARDTYRLAVRDRATLDRAMAEFLAGTRQPVLRRYTSDMLRERLAILGPPRNVMEYVSQIAIGAGTLLPDVQNGRTLARASFAYAQLLMEEGHPDEARPFIDAWQPFCIQMADDGFTLIDMLVAGAIAGMGTNNAAALYHELGDAAAEARTRQAATALGAPMAAYRSRVKNPDPEADRTIRQHAGVLAGMLLPAIGEQVSTEDLRAGRMVEYVLLDQTTCGAIDLLLVLTLFAALLVALRWRFLPGGRGVPLLLLPTPRQLCHVLGYGVVLPIGVYALWTLLPPLAGRDLSLSTAWPVAMAQAVALVTWVVVIVLTLASRAIRTRCDTLGVPVPPAGATRRLPWILAVAAGLMPALVHGLQLAVTEGAAHTVTALCLATLVVGSGLSAGALFVQGLFGSPRFGLYRGTVARSLIPHLALAAVLVTALTTHYLRTAETRLVRNDPLLAPSTGAFATGFTAIEARLVERLRGEMLHAAGR